MKALFSIILMTVLTASALADQGQATTIISEYEQIRAYAQKQEAEYMVGHFMSAKQYDDALLLWQLDDDEKYHEVIRLYREREDGTSFAVSYHRSSSIVDGKIVIRRFIGTEPSGWINHTVDYKTGEYLGSQGTEPFLTEEEEKMLKNWKVKFF